MAGADSQVVQLSHSARSAPSLEPDWGDPHDGIANDVEKLSRQFSELCSGLKWRDVRSELSHLVSANGLRSSPVHRWYFYKEAFSPSLPILLERMLGSGTSGVVVDPFAGVATTALSFMSHGSVRCAIGVEYSPFASFVGMVKIASLELDPTSLARHIDRYRDIDISYSSPKLPELTSFHNEEIFDPEVLHTLLALRDMVREDSKLSEAEKNFFLLGLVAVLEDMSKTMKDGRALRILRGRIRRRQGLTPSTDACPSSDVFSAVSNQWRAMKEDVFRLSGDHRGVSLTHVRGDARALDLVTDEFGEPLIGSGTVGLHIYSPPYLNCIDYSEVYKLELWFMEFVKSQADFRTLRLGTLRSHPSIEFADRPMRYDQDSSVFVAIEALTEFLTRNLARPSVGRIVRLYFADMYDALVEQFRTLESGGAIACIVANSMFSRREARGDGVAELWRIPILSDVLIARLAEAVGFSDVEILIARNLRPKNVGGGISRESVVIARKSSF